jgi:mono/diheme cytochrome c family protein
MKAIAAILTSLAGGLAIALLATELPAAAERRSAQIERGRHLVVEVGLCVDCHAPRLANGNYDQDRWLMGAPLPFKPVAEMP